MKHSPIGVDESQALLAYLNQCHDAVIRKILISKDRTYDETGDISFPCDDIPDLFVRCEVEIEMLLNSYQGSKIDQVVVFRCVGVRDFFVLQHGIDFAEIYEASVGAGEGEMLHVVFCASSAKAEVISIDCERIECCEN